MNSNITRFDKIVLYLSLFLISLIPISLLIVPLIFPEQDTGDYSPDKTCFDSYCENSSLDGCFLIKGIDEDLQGNNFVEGKEYLCDGDKIKYECFTWNIQGHPCNEGKEND